MLFENVVADGWSAVDTKSLLILDIDDEQECHETVQLQNAIFFNDDGLWFCNPFKCTFVKYLNYVLKRAVDYAPQHLE